MNVVIADADLCYPATSGKRLRTLQLMQRLATRHRITYVCRCEDSGAKVEKARAYLATCGIEPVLVAQPRPRKAGVGFYARLAANLLSPLPYSVTCHAGAPIHEAIQTCAETRHVDLWHFEWPAYRLALGNAPGAPTVIATHNVESLIWQRYCQTESNPLRRWFVKRQWRKYERLERHVYGLADRVVTCSAEDKAIVRDDFRIPRVDVVENGVDVGFFDAGPRVERQTKRILFLGALDYRPNIDAVGLLLDTIFPEVLKHEPRARLWIVGRNPPRAIAARVATVPNVELKANVSDVRPYLAEAGVMTVPLRIGGGSRLKILEALAAGLPVVSTRIGAEGLRLIAGEHIEIVGGVEGMAAGLVDAMRDSQSARAMAERGRQLVRQSYDWDILAGKLQRVWEKTRARYTRKQSRRASCRTGPGQVLAPLSSSSGF